MPSRASKLLTSLSFFLLSLILIFWIAANTSLRPHLTAAFPIGRLLLNIDHRAISLNSLPTPTNSPDEAAVRAALTQITNADISFACMGNYDRIWQRRAQPDTLSSVNIETSHEYRALEDLRTSTGALIAFEAYRRPLLEALEDRNRFVAAHLLLHRATTFTRNQFLPSFPLTLQGDFYVADLSGLRVQLPLPFAGKIPEEGRGPPGRPYWLYYLDRPNSARIDPAQIPSLRALWHPILVRPLIILPHWLIAAVLALLPARWALHYLLSHRRRLHGRCGECGYDLRATTGACPECGTAP